jgi:flagellar secretion chaperone FliS
MLNPVRRDRGVGAYEALHFFPDAVAPDKRRLVEMLLDGLAASLASARRFSAALVPNGLDGEAARHLCRAHRILTGLVSALEPKADPELAENLASIYRYLMRCIDDASQRGDRDRLDEAIGLVSIIRGAWASK